MELITDYQKLKIRSEKVSQEEAKEIISKLEETLKQYPIGIGLSAIQINIPKMVGIIRIKELKIDLINAFILEKDDKFRMKNEACLSLPRLSIDTARYNWIKINNNGKIEGYKGIVAVAIQHEVDHFKGITIIDRKWRKH